MIRVRNVLVFGLLSSLVLVGCGQKQEQSGHSEQEAKQEMSQLKESVTKQAEEMAAKGSKIIDQAKSEAGAMKEKTASIIKELIAKARTLLDQGKFNEAVVPAQEVLNNYDSDSAEAKGIIATATEKLKAMAEKAKEKLNTAATGKTQEDLKSTATEKAEDIKSGITDKLKSFGQ